MVRRASSPSVTSSLTGATGCRSGALTLDATPQLAHPPQGAAGRARGRARCGWPLSRPVSAGGLTLRQTPTKPGARGASASRISTIVLGGRVRSSSISRKASWTTSGSSVHWFSRNASSDWTSMPSSNSSAGAKSETLRVTIASARAARAAATTCRSPGSTDAGTADTNRPIPDVIASGKAPRIVSRRRSTRCGSIPRRMRLLRTSARIPSLHAGRNMRRSARRRRRSTLRYG